MFQSLRLGVPRCTYHEVTSEAPFKAIIHAAELTGCDAIFIGTRGLRARCQLKSQNLGLTSPCP